MTQRFFRAWLGVSSNRWLMQNETWGMRFSKASAKSSADSMAELLNYLRCRDRGFLWQRRRTWLAGLNRKSDSRRMLHGAMYPGWLSFIPPRTSKVRKGD